MHVLTECVVKIRTGFFRSHLRFIGAQRSVGEVVQLLGLDGQVLLQKLLGLLLFRQIVGGSIVGVNMM